MCDITARRYKNVFSSCISSLKGSYSKFFSSYYGCSQDFYNSEEKVLIDNADRSLESWIEGKLKEISGMDNKQAKDRYENFEAVMKCAGMMYLNKQCLSPKDKISIEDLAKVASLRSSIASRNDLANAMCSNMLINTLRLKQDYDVIKSRDDFFRQMTESIKGVNRFEFQQLINNIFSYCTKDRLEVGLSVGGEKKLEYNKAEKELLITMQDDKSHGVQLRVSNLNDKPIFKYKFNACREKFDEVSLPKDMYPNICHDLFELCHKVVGEEYYLVVGEGNVSLQKKGIQGNIEPKACKSTILLDLYEKLGSGREKKDLKQVAETFTQYFKNLEEDKKYKNEKRIDEFTPSKAYWGRVCRPKECNNTIAYGPTKFYSVHLNNKNKPRRCY